MQFLGRVFVQFCLQETILLNELQVPGPFHLHLADLLGLPLDVLLIGLEVFGGFSVFLLSQLLLESVYFCPEHGVLGSVHFFLGDLSLVFQLRHQPGIL